MKRALIGRLRFLENIPNAFARNQETLHTLADSVASTDPDYATSLRALEPAILKIALLQNMRIDQALDWMIGA